MATSEPGPSPALDRHRATAAGDGRDRPRHTDGDPTGRRRSRRSGRRPGTTRPDPAATDPADRSRALPAGAAVLWIVAGVVYLAAEAITASAFPGYSYATDYISDLGIPGADAAVGRAIGSPLHRVMNIAFVAHGVLFAGAAVLAVRATRAPGSRWFVALAVVHGLGIVLVGVVHSGQADTDDGLAMLHGVGAAMAIVGGNLAVITVGRGLRRTSGLHRQGTLSMAFGVLGLVSVATLTIQTGTMSFDVLPKGALERMSVYTITVWEITTGVAVLVLTRRGARRAAA